MDREKFKKIIKLRSCWKIDKRVGDYKLPNNEKLSDYVTELVKSQLELDRLAISSDGKLVFSAWDDKKKQYELYIPFGENENCSYYEQEIRIEKLVKEIIK